MGRLVAVVGIIAAGWLGLIARAEESGLPPSAARKVAYDADVRPLLEARCGSCHGPKTQKGGLRLDRRDSAVREGDEESPVLPGRGAESLLVKLAAGLDPDRIMPPKGVRLTAEEVGLLRAWIDQGAEWSGARVVDDRRDWWSLRPLLKPVVPGVTGDDAHRVRGPVDAFVLDRLHRQGLRFSSEANRRTLIRRVTFDLIGLPPTPAEIAAFVGDPAPDAYERLVDRLLASPHYGERWARHWLDVAHYGDTHGYDKDQIRPNAWPYRDYVVRALNADLPYGRFVRQQVAGDALESGDPDGVVALGFLAAGPWDLIGHAEVPETKVDGKIARHLDRDDMVATTLNTVCGLTVQCAQCHDHKFDPVPQGDYYRLQAVFAAVDRADRPFYTDANEGRRASSLLASRDASRARLEVLDATIQRSGGVTLAELDQRLVEARRPAEARPEFGYHSALETSADRLKWVRLDLGQTTAVERVVLWGAYDDFNGIGAGFGFPPRFRVELSDDTEFRSGTQILLDRTDRDGANPGIVPQLVEARGARGRYLRVTATKLAPRQGDFHFALAEVEVFDELGVNRAVGREFVASDSIEMRPRWGRANLGDGYAPGRSGVEAAKVIGELERRRAAWVMESVGASVLAERTRVARDLAEAEAGLASLVPSGWVYAATVYSGSGAFRGTGPDGGKPRPIHVLRRGDVRSPGKEVGPGAPGLFEELPGDFSLPTGHHERERRGALATWLSDPRNPLTWRCVVNRVWQYHFGRGIAATPNDLGRMGQAPSHPKLLDWLAANFRDGGQSLKALHRGIVTSSAYRQVSASENSRGAEVDSDNGLLWRMNRRKLEAEAIRDATLAAAGTLDGVMFGPPFRDFAVDHPEHSPHYEYGQVDPDETSARRRSIYRFLARSRPQPFMAALDCADPSMQVDRRNETLSPLQALTLYNNGLMLVTARHLAERVANGTTVSDRISEAFLLAIGRSPSAEELASLVTHADCHGLDSACRVIFNLNEFVFVD